MTTTIKKMNSEELQPHLEGLSSLLKATVDANASISFMAPLDKDEALRFWQKKIFPSIEQGERVLFIAFTDDQIIGSVQLDIDMPPNQPHRCEIAKLMVHPDARRQGLAKQLMTKAIEEAKSLQKALITLDTRTGDNAEPLYHSLGFKTVGVIPGYALDPYTREKEGTTIMYLDI